MNYNYLKDSHRHIAKFDSFTEFVSGVETLRDEFTRSNHRQPNATSDGRSVWEPESDNPWRGTNTLQEAFKLAREGWSEGRAKVKLIADKLDIQSRVKKPHMVFDIVGDSGIDMGRVMSGEPENMIDIRESDEIALRENGPVVRIVVNSFMSGGVSRDRYEQRGAALVALVDALETSGRRVEIESHFTAGSTGSHRGQEIFEIVVPIKAADEHMQLDMLAFMLAHPAYVRRFMFASFSHCGDDGRREMHGLCGTPYDLLDVKASADIYIECMALRDERWESNESTQKWLEDTLDSLGVELEAQ